MPLGYMWFRSSFNQIPLSLPCPRASDPNCLEGSRVSIFFPEPYKTHSDSPKKYRAVEALLSCFYVFHKNTMGNPDCIFLIVFGWLAFFVFSSSARCRPSLLHTK